MFLIKNMCLVILVLVLKFKLVHVFVIEKFDDVNLTPGTECYRECSANESPKHCIFDWVLEQYHTMGPACGNCTKGVISDCYLPQCVTGDGIEKSVMSINRQIPGPQIHVCKNDIIIIDLLNGMGGTATTMHWHGFHQRKTPYMDGVPFITQCPINFGNKFRYIFRATEAGTQFYHSHAGHHKVNGLHGGIVVREFIKNDINSIYYDFDLPEHLIVLSDWTHNLAETYMPGLSSKQSIRADSIIVNGLGRYNEENTTTKTPLAVFSVKPGFKYRFRLVNSASHTCQYQIQIQDHNLQIIATDSYPIRPVKIDTLVSGSGERYDFIVNANKKFGNYLIKFQAIEFCEDFNLLQYAILQYVNEYDVKTTNIFNDSMISDFKLENADFKLGKVLNDPRAICYENKDSICVVDLEAYQKINISTDKPDHQFLLTYANYPIDFNLTSQYSHFMSVGNNVNLVGAVNNISFQFPSFSLLTQPDEIKEKTFCDETSMQGKCVNQICHCVHRIKVKLNSLVELFLLDDSAEIGALNHPFHLHGHQLSVIGMGKSKNNASSYFDSINRNSYLNFTNFPTIPIGHNPATKDTVSIPAGGYTVLRFRATNPGFWLMHCHFEWHMAVGMGLVVQVGEVNDMVKAPENFPKCGDYTLNSFDLNL